MLVSNHYYSFPLCELLLLKTLWLWDPTEVTPTVIPMAQSAIFHVSMSIFSLSNNLGEEIVKCPINPHDLCRRLKASGY